MRNSDVGTTPSRRAVVIGGGPAGLMAAEVLAGAGAAVEVYDAMPSVGRKFLMAGKGGLNITHAEPQERFRARYGDRAAQLAAALDAFGPEALRAWMRELGVESFVGSSGRVFPAGMKAAPLLRAWLQRLRAMGVRFHVRHRWLGWDGSGRLRFAGPDGERLADGAVVVLALGGGSWAKLGSDGRWVDVLTAQGIAVAPLRPANCGFDVAWSDHFRERFAGEPLKNVAAWVADPNTNDGRDALPRAGEFVITAAGIEGGLVYALSAALRDGLAERGAARFVVDLLPARTAEWVLGELSRPRGSRSWSSHLQSRLGIKGVRMALLRECLGRDGFSDPTAVAAAIKALPIAVAATRPLDEAISTAGGVAFESLGDTMMLRDRPGVFCAGEMLDWEAPTGGYLLTACFATGRLAGRGAAEWLRRQHS